MAYFAELDKTNIVIRVIKADSLEWVESVYNGTWLETFDDASKRYNFASAGYFYDSIDDAFIAPAPCKHEELFLDDKKHWQCNNDNHLVIFNES